MELRSKGLALSTPRKVPSSATRTGGFAKPRDGAEAEMRIKIKMKGILDMGYRIWFWFIGGPWG